MPAPLLQHQPNAKVPRPAVFCTTLTPEYTVDAICDTFLVACKPQAVKNKNHKVTKGNKFIQHKVLNPKAIFLKQNST